MSFLIVLIAVSYNDMFRISGDRQRRYAGIGIGIPFVFREIPECITPQSVVFQNNSIEIEFLGVQTESARYWSKIIKAGI